MNFLTDRKNGDYDTIAILYIKRANGEKVEVNRYFKENDVSFTEILFKKNNKKDKSCTKNGLEGKLKNKIF